MIEIGQRVSFNNKINNVLYQSSLDRNQKFNGSCKMISESNCGKVKTTNLNFFESDFKSVKRTRFIEQKHWIDDGVESFQQVIYPILFIGQVFALFPVHGIASKNVTDLKFKWFSWKMIYSYIMQFALCSMIAITVLWIIINKIEFPGASVIIFYGNNCVGAFLFITLAKKWPEIMLHWQNFEMKLPQYRTVSENKRLGRRIRRIAIIFCTFAVVEHLLCVSTGLYSAYRCAAVSDPTERFFRNSFPQLMYFTNFSAAKIIGPQLVNMFATFTWNFMDLFLIVVSISLTTRLHQINFNMEQVAGELVLDSFWELNRHHYLNFIELLAVVDRALEYLILLSFSNNLYSISMQLLNSFKTIEHLINAIYFWFSLIFLIARTFAVILYSSNINDESKRPMRVLYRVPTSCYTKEVKRFLSFVRHEKVALTGKQFFTITRHLILQIAGTIVTYELVLAQFTIDESDPNRDPCA